MQTWTLTVEDNGVVTLPDDLLAATGWQVGDHLQYLDNHDGTYTVIKEDLTNFIIDGIIKDE